MEEQKQFLEHLISTGADYIDILKQSQVVDEYIVNFYKQEVI